MVAITRIDISLQEVKPKKSRNHDFSYVIKKFYAIKKTIKKTDQFNRKGTLCLTYTYYRSIWDKFGIISRCQKMIGTWFEFKDNNF